MKLNKTAGSIVISSCLFVCAAGAFADVSQNNLTIGNNLSLKAVDAADNGNLSAARETATQAFEIAVSAPKKGDAPVKVALAPKPAIAGPQLALANLTEVPQGKQLPMTVEASQKIALLEASTAKPISKDEKIGRLAGHIVGAVLGVSPAIWGGIASGGLTATAVTAGIGSAAGLAAGVLSGAVVGLLVGGAILLTAYWLGGKIGGWIGRKVDDINNDK